MRRIATLGITGCTLAVLTCWVMELSVACIADLLPGSRDRMNRLDQQLQERERFQPRFRALVAEVAAGRQSLRDASRRLEQLAAERHPSYLEHVGIVAPGETLRTKLASQIVLHLDTGDSGDGPPLDGARHAELARQLEKMLADEAPAP
ncbi:MAG: hypothetical protein L0Y71_23730 [Gemmataceae bacterium]|nr:hypothetical protein [Gemmataceae bacterium]